MDTATNNAQTETIVKRILTSEVKYVIGICVFLAGVVAPFYMVKQDVALIKQNHYTHIEALTKQIEKNTEEIKKLNEDQVRLMEIIIENKTKINLYNKNQGYNE